MENIYRNLNLDFFDDAKVARACRAGIDHNLDLDSFDDAKVARACRAGIDRNVNLGSFGNERYHNEIVKLLLSKGADLK